MNTINQIDMIATAYAKQHIDLHKVQERLCYAFDYPRQDIFRICAIAYSKVQKKA